VAIQPREAEPQPGTRPDPKLERHERVQQERVGLPLEPATQAEHEREPIAVLADCMDREESEESASEYRQRALANADHLAVVYARWADLAGGADHERYQQLVNDALPQQYQEDDFGPEATWLWRTCGPRRWPGWTRASWCGQPSAPGPWPMPAAWPLCSTPACERS
jgi:hypothetical protein